MMEGNGLPAGIFSGGSSNVSSCAVLGLEMSLHQQRSPQNPNIQIPHHHTQINTSFTDAQHQPYPSLNFPISKQPLLAAMSDEDDSGFGGEDNDRTKRKSPSPWHRMKWTDEMVKLLITVVYYTGDEIMSEQDPKKKGMGGGVLQKKGKWKSVSKEMLGKGFSVSPQQCEDKFNDLNKRYKRVNDIIGRGTACKVVENQSLLDAMDHIPPKMKEEARKLLNSKHLFFREMCAYHNTCNSNPNQEPEPEPDPESKEDAETEILGLKNLKGGSDAEDDDFEEEDEEETIVRGRRRWSFGEEEVNELRNGWEKKEWVKRKMAELEERSLGFEWEGLQLERQRLKWTRYCGKKEREMEGLKVRNERMKLENERMMLVLRRKELELADSKNT